MIHLFIFSLGLISTTVKEGIIKAFKNETPTKYEKVFVKLHTGDPGAEGKNNVAGETKRKQVTEWVGTTTLKNKLALLWTAVSNAETIKYVSFWDAETAGNFLGNTIVEAEKTVAIGDNLEIPIEGLSWTVA